MKYNKFLLQHLLDDSASVYPERCAIKANNLAITYRNLAEKSNKLANLLVNSGLKPGSVVGIYMHKSIETVIAMFAVLKAGGAYIPIDSHYSPVSRILKIIELSGAEYIITTHSMWTELLDNQDPTRKIDSSLKNIILIDNILNSGVVTPPDFVEAGDHRNFYFYDDNVPSDLQRTCPVINDDLAYILYTSGSTGTPKGVMISHINALTFINWSLSCFEPTFEDVFSNFAPLHFDLSVFDIFVAIACGACVTMVPANIAGNPRAIIDWATRQKVTFWYSVPSVWVSIMNYASINPQDLQSLRYILFAGEVFPPKLLKELMVKLPKALYYNLYGPTETNVCTYHQVKSPDEITDRPVPIGKACENTEILVLNENDQPVAIGEEGELMVRGTIVTSGYYKNSQMTMNVFKKSPLPHHNEALFYKTSDIVRKRPDNTYEYIGRKDLMVKCAGFRIELQEIENTFYQNDSIEEAVVVPYTNPKNNATMLYAFVKVKKGVQFSIIESKRFLAKILPKYMVPEFIECIDNMPKNSNRKVDRTLLAEWAKNKLA